ncbi:cell division protein FtsZ, partial [Staphylococcus aureus]
EDKPTSQGRKASSTGFGTSATSSTSTQTSTPRERIILSKLNQALVLLKSVSERSHTTKDDDLWYSYQS